MAGARGDRRGDLAWVSCERSRSAVQLSVPYSKVTVVATKTDRLEARLTSAERHEIEQAASLASESVSSFLVTAAIQRAEAIVSERVSTSLPPDYFDRLLGSLDEPDSAPALKRAALRAARRSRIKPA
jgi:uncharacterized protein (DUF1778 family)